MDYRIIPGNCGGHILVGGGYCYQKNKARNTNIFWRCWRQNYHAMLKANVFDSDDGIPINMIVLTEAVHNHEPDDSAIKRAEVVNKMKKTVLDDPTIPEKRVYDATVSQLNR